MKPLFKTLAVHTGLGAQVWGEAEAMIRTFLIKQHERGISMTEALLIVHETAGAAAQHAANAVALQKPRRKGKKS